MSVNRAADMLSHSRAKFCCSIAALWAIFSLPFVASAQHQLSLAPMNLLPNAPTTYQMRDWHATAMNFDALAFNTTATGQFLPIPIRDDTPESPFLTVAYELPSYVGDNRFYGNGEPFAEGIPTLGAVLGSTLMGIDKSAGPLNWVSMTREYYINRNNEFIMMNRTDSASGHSAWYDIFPNILFYAIADRYPNETYLNSIQNQIDSRFFTAVNVMTAGGTAPEFQLVRLRFFGQRAALQRHLARAEYGARHGLDAACRVLAQSRFRIPALPRFTCRPLIGRWTITKPELPIRITKCLTGFGAYAAARMNAEHGGNYNIHKYLDWVFSRSAARPDMIMISGEQWGGQDVGGLMGGMRPCCSNPVQGYAFAMNTYVDVIAVLPIARYEDRYSRSIGKWMLNAANAVAACFTATCTGLAINLPSSGRAIRNIRLPTKACAIIGCRTICWGRAKVKKSMRRETRLRTVGARSPTLAFMAALSRACSAHRQNDERRENSAGEFVGH